MGAGGREWPGLEVPASPTPLLQEQRSAQTQQPGQERGCLKGGEALGTCRHLPFQVCHILGLEKQSLSPLGQVTLPLESHLPRVALKACLQVLLKKEPAVKSLLLLLGNSQNPGQAGLIDVGEGLPPGRLLLRFGARTSFASPAERVGIFCPPARAL